MADYWSQGAMEGRNTKTRKRKLERGGTPGPAPATPLIDPTMQEAIDRRYALQMADIEKASGKQYKLAGGGLSRMAGQSGFGMGSGIANKAWKNLERETAGATLQQQGILRQQQLAEELGIMTSERAHQQDLIRMREEYGLKGTEAERERGFKKWSQEYAADLTKQGWTHEDAMAEAERVWKSGESELGREFEAGEAALNREQTENLQVLSQAHQGDMEAMKAQLARDLQAEGLTADAAQQEADRQLAQWQTGEEMGWRREELGTTIDQQQWMQERIEALQREGWDVASAEAQAMRDWQSEERTSTQDWQSDEAFKEHLRSRDLLYLQNDFETAMFDEQVRADMIKSIFTLTADFRMAYAQGEYPDWALESMRDYIAYLSEQVGGGFEGPY